MYILYYVLGFVLLPGLIFAIWAQTKVSTTFNTYSKVQSSKGKTAAEVAKDIMNANGLNDVQIRRVRGNLTDHYDPKRKTLNLSDSVYNSSSIAAFGVAAHEAGHAVQHKEGYFYMKLRSALVVTNNILNTFLWPIVFIGLIFSFVYVDGFIGQIFLWSGVAIFGASVLFSLVTLPVEKNASKRALGLLQSTGNLDAMEVKGAKAVLDAAALTYVAALVMSILTLLRFLLFIFISRDR